MGRRVQGLEGLCVPENKAEGPDQGLDRTGGAASQGAAGLQHSTT